MASVTLQQLPIEDFLKKSEILIRLSKLSLLSESLEEGVECVLNQTVLLC